MSVRLIAQDLYRLIREIEQLEIQLANTPESRREPIEDRIRKLKAERHLIRSMLEGSKEPPAVKNPV